MKKVTFGQKVSKDLKDELNKEMKELEVSGEEFLLILLKAYKNEKTDRNGVNKRLTKLNENKFKYKMFLLKEKIRLYKKLLVYNLNQNMLLKKHIEELKTELVYLKKLNKRNTKELALLINQFEEYKRGRNTNEKDDGI